MVFHENEGLIWVVCFIGHRKIDNAERIESRLKEIIAGLISNGADTFLFGSKSDFDNVCWSVVAELQMEFPNIKRIKYNTPNEVAFTSKEERAKYERIYSSITHKEAHFTDYEESVGCALGANKNAYIMRNQEMIDSSDICVFYYDKNYLPPKRKRFESDILDYQPKSGTAIAYAYAKRKKKRIINLYVN